MVQGFVKPMLSTSECPPTQGRRPPGLRWAGGRNAIASPALLNLFTRHCHPS